MEHMKNTDEWGKFFPKEHSCFAYNESTAQEYFPLTKEKAVQAGFRWREGAEEELQVSRIVDAAQLPNDIRDVPDDILQWAVRSEKTGRPFRLVKQELQFYRTHNLPLPRIHPDERFEERFGTYANKPVIHQRQCVNCGKAVATTYSPERSERIYCEECYLKEVY
jgi:hypothetical protein